MAVDYRKRTTRTPRPDRAPTLAAFIAAGSTSGTVRLARGQEVNLTRLAATQR